MKFYVKVRKITAYSFTKGLSKLEKKIKSRKQVTIGVKASFDKGNGSSVEHVEQSRFK